MQYSLTCSCGDKMTVNANSLEEAKETLKGQMTPEAVSQHFSEKHPGQPVPPQEEVHQMIDQHTQEDMGAPTSGEATAENQTGTQESSMTPGEPTNEDSGTSQGGPQM